MVSDRGTIWRLSEVVNVIRVTEINPTQMNLTVLYNTFRLQMEWIQVIHSSPLGKYMYFICEFTPRRTGVQNVMLPVDSVNTELCCYMWC